MRSAGPFSKEELVNPRSERILVTQDRRDGSFLVSDDKTRLDIGFIHAFLSEEAYWSSGIPRSVVEKAIDHSLCFGLYDGETQIGFSRVVTDRATFAWLCDVFVIPAFRRRGLARMMITAVLEHPDMRGLRRTLLATRDAQELYRTCGFHPLPTPDRWMAIADPDVYSKARTDA
jgi:ribosomal protein S18 acetylase RimI-like enzyme